MADLGEKTIRDFGEQWTAYRENEGYYGSVELLRDFVGPKFDIQWIRGKKVADIGSGTGRIVGMLMEAGAAEVTAVEPSAAYAVLLENTARYGSQVKPIQGPGERIPQDGSFDYVFSFGVLHHIPEPGVVLQAAREALKPGGKMVAWFYAHEGNRLYLSVAQPLRKITTRLSHRQLEFLSGRLAATATAYSKGAEFAHKRLGLRLPMYDYLSKVFLRLEPEQRLQIAYDQLNPAYAKYYRRKEIVSLFKNAGFTDLELYFRHGYSWTVIATKN